jgi:hypothetical protein
MVCYVASPSIISMAWPMMAHTWTQRMPVLVPMIRAEIIPTASASLVLIRENI